MSSRRSVKYIHEGLYVAAVGVELIKDETEWSPYLSLEDACKLDDVREALRREDLKTAAAYGQIYEMHPVEQPSGDRSEGGKKWSGDEATRT